MYTVDASVWINGFDLHEVGHETSRKFLQTLRVQHIPIVVPNLLLIEVAAAIRRTRQNGTHASEFADALSQLPHVTFRMLDSTLATRAVTLAAQHGLRGADAVYAAVAAEAGTILVSLDREHLTRLKDVISVLTPEEALAG